MPSLFSFVITALADSWLLAQVVTKDMDMPVEWRNKGTQSSNLSDKFN